MLSRVCCLASASESAYNVDLDVLECFLQKPNHTSNEVSSSVAALSFAGVVVIVHQTVLIVVELLLS